MTRVQNCKKLDTFIICNPTQGMTWKSCSPSIFLWESEGPGKSDMYGSGTRSCCWFCKPAQPLCPPRESWISPADLSWHSCLNSAACVRSRRLQSIVHFQLFSRLASPPTLSWSAPDIFLPRYLANVVELCVLLLQADWLHGKHVLQRTASSVVGTDRTFAET